MRRSMRLGGTLLLSLAAGCHEILPPDGPRPSAAAEMGPSFDARTAGTIAGKVVWRGDVPVVPPFQVHAYLDYIIADRIRGDWPNPHVPAIDKDHRGVGEVAVFLRAVDPTDAKPWDHASVQVNIQSHQLTVEQGGAARAIGFVPRGGEMICVNQDTGFHALRVHGASFFTLPFVEGNRPTRRRLETPGLVELSCGAGHYWMRAYLFVLDHPYATLTDAAGSFTLAQVPPGEYQVAAWMPNWHVLSRERDPETGLISRIRYAPPVELERTVTVTPGRTTEISFEMEDELFSARNSPQHETPAKDEVR